jgi:NlpC/P60 family putative phage cell wall peptidase
MRRADIVTEARSWLGTNYRHQGRRKGHAIDCIGFVWGVARELGYNAEIPSNYMRSPKSQQVLDGCDKWLVRVEREELKPGDVLILWGDERGEAQHFAIVGEVSMRPTMIHAWSKQKKVVEHGITDFWRLRLVAKYEFPNLTDD